MRAFRDLPAFGRPLFAGHLTAFFTIMTAGDEDRHHGAAANTGGTNDVPPDPAVAPAAADTGSQAGQEMTPGTADGIPDDPALEATRKEFADAAVALFHAVAKPPAATGGTKAERVRVGEVLTLLVVAVNLALIYRFLASLFPPDVLDTFNKVVPLVLGTLFAAYVAGVSEVLRTLARKAAFRLATVGVLLVCVLPSIVTLRVPVQVSAPARLEFDRKPFRGRPSAELFVETKRFVPQELTIYERYRTDDEGPMTVTEVYPVGTWDLLWGTAGYWASKLKLRPGARLVTASYPLLAYNPGGGEGFLLVTGEFPPLYLRKMLRELPQSRRTRGNFATLSYPLRGVYMERVRVPPDTFDLVLYNEDEACGRPVRRVVLERRENMVDFRSIPCDTALAPP